MSSRGVFHWRGDSWRARLLLGYARHTPNHPAKIRLFGLLAGWCFPFGVPVRSSSGVRLLVDAGDYIGHSICVGGSYEPQSLALAVRLMSGGGTFVDVGCNFGLYCCSIAANASTRVLAIDASPAALVKLGENMRVNGFSSVTTVSAALHSKRSLAVLGEAPIGNLGATRVSWGLVGTSGSTNMVAALSLDEILKTLGVGEVRLMKIDVEGSEREVLEGLDLTAEYRPANIIMERSERVAAAVGDLASCFETLVRFGYEPFRVDGRRFEVGDSLPEENIWWVREDSLGGIRPSVG